MPRRRVLSDAERQRLTELPTSELALGRHYTLSDDDHALIHERRRDQNRLGFAVQLALFRFPGRALDTGEEVPIEIVSYLASQLGVDVAAWSEYATRGSTRREHQARLREHLGLRSYGIDEERSAGEWLMPRAMETENGLVLVVGLMEHLRRGYILLPRLAVLERLVSRVRHEAEQEIYRRTIKYLSAPQLAQLDALVRPSGDVRESGLNWLRQPPGKTAPPNLVRIIDRLMAIQELALGEPPEDLPPQRMLKLARMGARMTPYHFAESESLRRQAVLAAHLRERRSELIDEAILMQDRLFGSVWARARYQQVDFLQQRKKGFRRAVRLLVKIGHTILLARERAQDAYEALDAVVAWPELQTAVGEAETLVDAKGYETLANLDAQYTTVRRYAPRLLSALEFRAAPAREDLLTAVEILRELNRTGGRKIPATAPTSFVPTNWLPYVEDEGGRISRRYYELCVLSEMRNALRSGDLFVRGSRHYRDFDDYLLSVEEYRDRRAVDSLAIEPSVDDYLGDRSRSLAEALHRVSGRLEAGDLSTLRLEPSGRIRLKRVPSQERYKDPIFRTVYSLFPRVKITDVLLDVDRWTGFSQAFTHLRSGEPAQDRRVLLTAILADGTNLGLTKMAQACPDVTLRKLAWAGEWFIRDDTYSQALAEIVNYQHQLPFARHWGTGTTSASDGQRYRAGSHGAAYGQRNARYGRDPSVMVYTHISDQYGPYHSRVIDASWRDATFVLDGLLDHSTELEINEHYTDTAGFTDHVFALCRLLGYRFAPRIRALTDYNLYFVDAPPATVLDPLVGGRVSSRRIRNNWESVLRLAASIQAGTVSASLMLRKLASYPRQNEVAFALREMGRLERSLFALEWFDDPALQGRTLAGLNKAESKNYLAQAVFLNRLDEFRDRSYEDQLHRASGLNLLVAAISLWNTVYLEKATAEMQRRGVGLTGEQLAHLAPMGWDHIALTGEYNWHAGPESVNAPLRPLRLDRLRP